MSNQIQAVARVQVTVEVDTSAWSENCSIGQLYKQAAEEAREKVRKSLTDAKFPHRLIGDPKVIGVMTEKGSSV